MSTPPIGDTGDPSTTEPRFSIVIASSVNSCRSAMPFTSTASVFATPSAASRPNSVCAPLAAPSVRWLTVAAESSVTV